MINMRYVIWNNLFLSGQCSHKGAAEAAFVCDASLCAAELQACSGLGGQGERTGHVCCKAARLIITSAREGIGFGSVYVILSVNGLKSFDEF